MKIFSLLGNKRYTLIIALIIVQASACLIAVNYYSIKLVSATRAYVNAESQYSKAQKKATRYLISFVETRHLESYHLFKKELSIPIGDKLARTGMENGDKYAGIKNNLISGRNHSTDIDDMIWLFNTCSRWPSFNDAIKEWEAGDKGISNLDQLGRDLYKKLIDKSVLLSKEEEESIKLNINLIDTQITQHQEKLADILGKTSRVMTSMLMYFNIVFILLILISAGVFAGEMIRQLIESKKVIERQNDAKDEFMSIASHELKTPLTSMKASLQILERFARTSSEGHRIHPFISNSTKQVNRLIDLVNELLDVTKIQQGKLQLNKTIVSLPDLITEAVEEVKPTSRHEYLIQKMPSAHVYTDRSRISQVIVNFLTNAAKYSPSQTKIIIGTELKENTIKVFVQDFGVGVQENKLPLLFERFYRVEETESIVQGLGLGLYICCEIIKSHNGHIGAKSELGKGSTFWFDLPLAGIS